MEASLYIHVPFCAGSCDYCDFYSIPLMPSAQRTGDSRLEAYVAALLSDGERLFEKFRPDLIPAVYIGGGTPSVLGQAGIRALLTGILELILRYAPLPDEITVEANPESADEAFLAAACESGATRLSLGLQTFNGPSRRAVNRIWPVLNSASSQASEPSRDNDETRLTKRLALTAEYFPGAFSTDLISGLPFQNENILLNDIKTALSFNPAHVSLYALTLEPGTLLAKQNAAKHFLPGCDEADRLWICGRDALEKAGFRQYEVSNFCLEGKESRHNIRYWRMLNWLALGPAASGTIINDESGTGLRYTVPPDVDLWLSGNQINPWLTPGPFCEELDFHTLIKETLLMGFRYVEGPDEQLFQKRFRRSICECIPKTLEKWKAGFFRNDKNALTKEGLLFLNSFLADAFLELDSGLKPE